MIEQYTTYTSIFKTLAANITKQLIRLNKQ